MRDPQILQVSVLLFENALELLFSSRELYRAAALVTMKNLWKHTGAHISDIVVVFTIPGIVCKQRRARGRLTLARFGLVFRIWVLKSTIRHNYTRDFIKGLRPRH